MGKFKKGFTLVELLVTLTILSVVMTVIYSAFLSTLNIKKSVSDKSDIQESATNVQRLMYSDIRRAKEIMDSSYDATLNRWTFPGTEMAENNAYCRAKGYKPLIYLESINGDKSFYAYSVYNQQLLKIIIPVDNTRTSVKVNYPVNINCDDTTKGTDWSIIPNERKNLYAPPYGSNEIFDEVNFQGLVISTKDSSNNPITIDNFIKIGAFKSGTDRILVLQSINTIDGENPWLLINIREEELNYYLNTSESIISKYVAKNGAVDGIVLNKFATGAAGQSSKGYYNIKLHLRNKDLIKDFEFKVSMVDYGGDIK